MFYLQLIACCLSIVVVKAQVAYQGGSGSASSAVSATFNPPIFCGMFRGSTASGAVTGSYASGQNCIFFKGSSGSAQAANQFDNPASCPAFYASVNGASAYDARSYSDDFGGCYFVALPIEASPLFAKIEDNEGLLYWSTYAEVDNEGFEVQKSFDAVHWESIGWVNGAGNYQGTISYEFLDRSLQYRQQYYRTVQMDYDGQSTISNIVHLHPSQSKPKRNHIAIYPNPIQVGNTLKVRAWLQDELQGSIKLYSIMGQLLFVQAFSFDTFNQLIELPIDNLSAGHYLLIIEDNQGQSLNQQKIVVTP